MAITDPLIGQKLGDYTIQEVLGQGGMARVYRGYDEKLARYAAVKVIDAQTIVENEDEYRDRFRREARAIARLKHPNIVNIYQFGEDGTLYYMAMEFVQGQDLREIIKKYAQESKVMPLLEMMRVIKDIAWALDYAHSEGVIHRDVKPSNIMVKPDGQAVLMDFGLALSVPEGTIGTTFGSVHYIAPEQAVSSARAVPQSDLYSLGVVLFEMLTGRVPFDDQSTMSVALKHLSDPPPSPSMINPTITPEVEEIVLKSLDKEPRKRFVSGMAMARALELALGGAIDPNEDLSTFITKDTATSSRKSRSRPLEPIHTVDTSKYKQAAATYMADDPTISESKRPGVVAKKQKRSNLGVLLLLSAVVLLAAGVVGVLLANNGQGTAADSTNVALAAVTDDEPTSESVVATEPPTRISPPTATEVPPTAVVTEAVVAVPTEETTENAQITLYYDERTLLLTIAPDASVDLATLVFTRTDAEGQTFTFESSMWGDSALNATDGGDCLQVWTGDFNFLDANDELCPGSRQGYRQLVAASRHFWLSDEADATFIVEREGEVLATCPASPTDETEDYQFSCAVAVP